MFEVLPFRKSGGLLRGLYADYLPSVNKPLTLSAEVPQTATAEAPPNLPAEEPQSPPTNDLEIVGYRKNKFISPICISEDKHNLIVSIRPYNPERWAVLEDYLEKVTKLNFAASATQIERSQVIAMNTSHLAREILFRPVDLKSCNLSDAKNFEQEIATRIRNLVLEINGFESSLAILRRKLRAFSQKVAPDQVSGPNNNVQERQKEDIKNWRLVAKEHREVLYKSVCARLILFQLKNATIRHEPKTGFIHMKTKVWFSTEQERDTISSKLLKVPMFEKCVPVDEKQMDSAISSQITCLEEYAQIIKVKDENGNTRVFESLFNNKHYDAFELSFPFDRYPPRMCVQLFHGHFAKKPPGHNWVCFPVHIDPLALEHKARFYVRCDSEVKFDEYNQETGSVMTRLHESKYCLKCIGKGRDSCPRSNPQALKGIKCVAKKRPRPKDEGNMVLPIRKRKP